MIFDLSNTLCHYGKLFCECFETSKHSPNFDKSTFSEIEKKN